MQFKTKETLKIYWYHVKKYPISVIAIILAVIFAGIAGVATPWYFKKFFDVLSQSGLKSEMTNQLFYFLFIIAGLEFFNWIMWRISSFTASYFQSSVIADLSNYCFQYLHKHSFGYFNNNFVGSLVKRVNRFTRSFESIADRLTWNILSLVINVVLVVGVLFTRNLWLGISLVIWIIIFLIVNALFIRYKLPYDLKRSDADTRTSGILADTITNHANLKLFNGYRKEVRTYGNAVTELKNLRRFTWNLGMWFEAVQGFLTTLLELGLFFLAVKLWQKDLITVGDFVLIQTYVLMVILRIWDFGKIIQRVYEDLADAEEMTEILVTPHEIVDVPAAKKLQINQGGEVIFDEVDFNYHLTRGVLKKFNLIIKPGEKIALVGPSGAGKTTIVKILLRLYDVSGGKILIDGQNIAKITQESLWQNISMVPQDPILFHRTLMENIRYGRHGATDEEVLKAAKLANCHNFIKDLPEGYNTYVGERGVKLSGGERQRVAIARAILHNAPILILDEATSSLDSESEKLIQDALDKLIKGKTVIVVAHRLSTIMKMDRIIVIKDGKIFEEGSHKELLKQKGIYNRLWQVQAGGFIS